MNLNAWIVRPMHIRLFFNDRIVFLFGHGTDVNDGNAENEAPVNICESTVSSVVAAAALNTDGQPGAFELF